MSNSDNDNAPYIEITRESADLTELPTDDPKWLEANGLFLQHNNITELNADTLPKGLKFLDLTDNPITKITGTFPSGLLSLVLTKTKIEKLGLLPESLTELVINDTPMAKKYGIDSDVRNKDMIKRLSNITIEHGTIMVDNTPGERDIEDNSNNNSIQPDVNEIKENKPSVNEVNESNNNSLPNVNEMGGGAPKPKAAYNSDDTRYLVMILEKVEDEKDIQYRVQTLNQGEKLVFKQHLEPYEPNRANEIKPLDLTNPPMVYTKEGHGEDILFEHPVPPGCVYVTIEECSILSSNWGKLLFAFQDKPAGIREKLRDPIRYKRELHAHFGRAFHVHYPGAERHADRTYIDCIHYPFLAWNREECKIGKSGVLSLDDKNVFVDESIVSKKPYDEDQVLKVVDHNNITDEDLHKLLDGSKFPTYEMVKEDIPYTEDGKLKYTDLKKVMDRYAFTQSWSFKMFPGVHYNFSCRDIAKHSEENERIGRRRAQSLEGPSNNINAMTNDEVKGDIGFGILSGYVDAGILPMIPKMVARGVDVNRIRPDGKTLLASVAGRFRVDTVKELLKVPGIDKGGAVEAVEESVTKMIEGTKDEDKKKRFRKEADELIAILKGIAGGKRNRKKTRGRTKRIRRTRRVKRFK
jgi:hypothetical protein